MRSIFDDEREFFQRFKIDDLVMYGNQLVLIDSYHVMSCSIWLVDENGKRFRISTSDVNRLSPI